MVQSEQTDNSVLMAMFHHNTWANLKLLEFCEGLRDEQLDTSAASTYGSIRATLQHMVIAEVGYAHRASKLPGNPVEWEGFPGFEVLKQSVRRTGEALPQAALSARADTIVRRHLPELKLMREYTLSGLMVQVITHAAEHREQVSAMITQLGLEPPDTSAWQYLIEMGEYHEIPATEH